MSTPENNEDTNRLAAGQLIIKCEIAAILGLVQELSRKLGVTEIDGHSLLEEFVLRRKLQLQNEIAATDGCVELEKYLKAAVDQSLTGANT